MHKLAIPRLAPSSMTIITYDDFQSSIELIENLINFSNNAFQDTSVLLKIDLQLLKKWQLYCRSFAKAINFLREEQQFIKNLNDVSTRLFSTLCQLLKEPKFLVESYWIENTLDELFNLLMVGIVEATSSASSLSTRAFLNLIDSQDRFKTMRNFCLAFRILDRLCSHDQLGHQASLVQESLKSFLLTIKDIIRKRLAISLIDRSVIEFSQLEMIERDLLSCQMIGRISPYIDSFSMAIFR